MGFISAFKGLKFVSNSSYLFSLQVSAQKEYQTVMFWVSLYYFVFP